MLLEKRNDVDAVVIATPDHIKLVRTHDCNLRTVLQEIAAGAFDEPGPVRWIPDDARRRFQPVASRPVPGASLCSQPVLLPTGTQPPRGSLLLPGFPPSLAFRFAAGNPGRTGSLELVGPFFGPGSTRRVESLLPSPFGRGAGGEGLAETRKQGKASLGESPSP